MVVTALDRRPGPAPRASPRLLRNLSLIIALQLQLRSARQPPAVRLQSRVSGWISTLRSAGQRPSQPYGQFVRNREQPPGRRSSASQRFIRESRCSVAKQSSRCQPIEELLPQALRRWLAAFPARKLRSTVVRRRRVLLMIPQALAVELEYQSQNPSERSSIHGSSEAQVGQVGDSFGR